MTHALEQTLASHLSQWINSKPSRPEAVPMGSMMEGNRCPSGLLELLGIFINSMLVALLYLFA